MEILYAVGHITDDLNPEPHIGGAVTYAAMATHQLGAQANVITKAPAEHPYIEQLTDAGINVHNLPVHNSELRENITSFWNAYDKAGNRTQIVSKQQESITTNDLSNFPDIPSGATVLIAPVMDEVDPQMFERLGSNHRLVIAPQGYFRRADDQGNISRRPWRQIELLSQAELVVLSDEDLTFDGEFSQGSLDKIVGHCGKVVLTQGSKGLTVYQADQPPIEIKAFELSQDEVISPTGAGDSCAAALAWHYTTYDDVRQAAAFGSLYPALKIMGLGGKRGITALPTIEQVTHFTDQNPDRFSNFLAANALKFLKI